MRRLKASVEALLGFNSLLCEAHGVSALADSLGASQRPLGNTAKSSPTCDAKTQQWDKRAERKVVHLVDTFLSCDSRYSPKSRDY